MKLIKVKCKDGNDEELKKALKATITQKYEDIDWDKLYKLGFKDNGTKTKRAIADFLIAKNWD